MEIVYDFLEGRCNYETFVKHLQSNDEIFNWLQSLYFEEMLYDKSFKCENSLWRSNGSVKTCIGDFKKFHISIYVENDIYNFIYHYLTYALPERTIKKIDYYEKRAHLYTDAVNDCFGGIEVDGLISAIIDSVPKNFSKKEKIKYVKVKLNALFPGNKRPFWIEFPEWPTFNGKPMVYIERKRNGDLFQYVFEDADSGKQRIVEQFA